MKTILSLFLIIGFLFFMDYAFPYDHPCDDDQSAQVELAENKLPQAVLSVPFSDASSYYVTEADETVYNKSNELNEPVLSIAHEDNCPFHPDNLKVPDDYNGNYKSFLQDRLRANSMQCTSCHVHAMHYVDNIHIGDNRRNLAPESERTKISYHQPSLYDDEWLEQQKAKERIGRSH